MALPTSRNTTYAAGSQVLSADLNALQDYLMDALGAALPGGRLTLTTAVPVTTGDVSAATSVRYAPYKSNRIGLYDGTRWVLHTFTELSQTTADNTKSPAAVANDSNYDVFVWNDAGTLRATRGPAWTSGIARGTGAGTTELELLNGRYVNKIAITNGPAAQRGLYVGSVGSDGSAQVNDTLAKRDVWNNYNRVPRLMKVIETTDTWGYQTDTFRQVRATASNQLEYLQGLAEDPVFARARLIAGNSNAASYMYTGIGIDSTSVNSATRNSHIRTAAANHEGTAESDYQGFPGIGRHLLVWLEAAPNTGTVAWFGDLGDATRFQSGIFGEILA
jgi:hypothetical protein